MNEIAKTQKGKSTEVGPRIDEGRPIPPRYWWLKRLSISSGLFVIFLICLRLWWGWEANRRLQAEIDSYYAAGQPVYAGDFEEELALVPDDQNAALLLEEAVQAISYTTVDERFFDVLNDPLGQIEDFAAIGTTIRTNRTTLELVREARSKSMVAWNWAVVSVGRTPSLRAHRQLAKLLWLAAVHANHQRNHAEMLERIMDMLAHAQSISAHPSLICNLVGMAIEALAVELIEDFGATVNLDRPPGQNDSPTVRYARKARIRHLIELLLDEELARHSAIRACYAERAYFLNLTNMLTVGPGNWAPPSGHIIDAIAGPIFTLDTLRGVRAQTDIAQAVREASWPVASTVFPVYLPAHSLLQVATRPLTEIWLPSYERWVELFYRRLAMRRMGALALAIRLYEVDHGHRPDMLVQLVPAFLPAVPADPFATDGIEIRYKLEAKHPVLYSIGADGKDDGGIGPRRPDLLFYLDGKPTKREEEAAPSSTEAGEDDENTEDSQGEGQ